MLFPVHVTLWLLRLAVTLPLWLLGFPVVLGLALTRSWEARPSRFYTYADGSPRIVAQWPRWAVVWNDEEQGVAGPREWMQGRPAWLRAFVWGAWRNPTNGLRFIWPFGITIDSARIRVRANCTNSPQDDWAGDRILWSYVWQGVFAGFWIRWPRAGNAYGQFRIGWKLLPRDARGVPDFDYRSKGCGFGLQFHWRRQQK